MTFDEFKDKIYLGWMNQGTYIEITLYYVDRFNPTENKQKNMINKCFVNFKGIGTKLRKYLMIREDFQYITC